MEKKVFVVYSTNTFYDETSVDIVAVCSTIEEARQEMKTDFEEQTSNITEDFNMDDLKITKGSNYSSIFDTLDCMEYRVDITEKTLK